MLRRRIFNFFCCTLVLLIGQAAATAQINPIQGVHYRYEVIAASNPNLELYGAPSINDIGDVAFAGKLNGGGAVFIGDGPGSYWQLLPNFNQSNHIFGGTVVINNQKQVIAHETVTGTSPLVNILRLIDGNTTNSSTIIAAANLYQYDDYDQLYPTGLSLNDDYNEVGWVGRLGQQTTVLGTGVRPNFNERVLRSTGGTPRPVRSVNGYTVTRVGNLATDDLMLYYPDMTPCCRVAGTADGFTAVGQSPGISDGGEAIVFYGVLSEAGAQAVGLTAGPGIFAAVEVAPEQRQLFRLTGKPAELGYTQSGQPISFNSYDSNERVDVGYESDGLPGIQDDVVTISFGGTPSAANDSPEQQFSNQRGLWTLTAKINVDAGGIQIAPDKAVPVVQVGDAIEGQAITNFSVSDQIGDNYSRVAFAAETSTGRMIVRAETDKTPVIFVPGIAGSRLVGEDGKEVWLDLSADHNRLSLDPNPTPEKMTVPGVVLQAKYGYSIPVFIGGDVYKSIITRLINEGYDEYKVTNESQRTTEGCDLSQRPNQPSLFVFAYDWRKSNVVNAGELQKYIGCVKQFYGPNTKINIVAHSQGGLLTRRYILDNAGAHSIDKMVTIGSPWLGAPKAIEILKNGNFLQKYGINFINPETVKGIAPFFTGMHELFPSKLYDERATSSIYYLNDYGSPFREQGWDLNGDGNPYERYSHSQLVEWLDKQNPRANPLLGKAMAEFHDNAGQDDWRGDASGVKYLHIYGEQGTDATTTRVLASTKSECSIIETITRNCNIGEQYYAIDKGPGDGTVPTISAERWFSPYYDSGQPKNDYPLFGTNSTEDSEYEHVSLTSSPKSQDAVIDFLRNGTLPDSSVSFNQSARAVPEVKSQKMIGQRNLSIGAGQSSSPAKQLGYYVTVLGVNFVEISDDDGNSNTRVDANHFGVPGIYSYDTLGRAAQLITTTTEKHLTFKFKTGNEPILVEVLKGVGNKRPQEAVRYRDVTISANVNVKIELSPKGISDLRYDRDGNGSYETIIQPTAHLYDTAALDTTPPTVQISEDALTTRQLVVNAMDNETGVRHIMYSFDGRRFQKYLAPIQISLEQTGTLFVFADDNAANRSTPIRYSFAKRLLQP